METNSSSAHCAGAFEEMNADTFEAAAWRVLSLFRGRSKIVTHYEANQAYQTVFSRMTFS